MTHALLPFALTVHWKVRAWSRNGHVESRSRLLRTIPGEVSVGIKLKRDLTEGIANIPDLPPTSTSNGCST